MSAKDEHVSKGHRAASVAVTVLMVVSGGSVLAACGSASANDPSGSSPTGLSTLQDQAPEGYTAKASGVTTVTAELIAKATPTTEGMEIWPAQCAQSFQSSAAYQEGSTVETVTFTGQGQMIVIGLQSQKEPHPANDADNVCDTGSFRAPGGEGFFRVPDPVDLNGVPAKGKQIITLTPDGSQQSVTVSYTANLSDREVLTLSVIPDLSSNAPRLVVDSGRGIDLYKRAAELVQ
ncbi:DUF5642 family protein [Rhodococcus sp. WAY2]|uniref:DUF5642 family protein n=1 Tax=Rhodococcus sp. WAY2 TaxID=2663121 RepID=UPI00131FC394|nr:DUF5642 family protein [Rhodococcus sp. WAY2]QHE73355.1 hypothetical protein GFS60_07014 [Rhodococcus sp. WAY2]